MKKYLAESGMIVFSVLFALMINSLVENRATNKKKEAAIASLSKEINNNRATIERWREKHSSMYTRLSEVAFGKNDSLMQELKKQPMLNMGVLFENANLIDYLLQSTAWETVKETDLLNEFEFETVKSLSEAYDLQNLISDVTVQRIIDNFYLMETLKTENIEVTLIQISMMMSELVGQENIMPMLFDKAIDELEKEK